MCLGRLRLRAWGELPRLLVRVIITVIAKYEEAEADAGNIWRPVKRGTRGRDEQRVLTAQIRVYGQGYAG